MTTALTDEINNEKIYDGYNKKNKFYNFKQEKFENIYDNTNNKLKKLIKKCDDDCIEKCITDKNFNDCIDTCRDTLPSCSALCNEDPTNSNYCSNSENSDVINGDCPKVYKKNDEYKIHISENSSYSKTLNFCGEQSYGKNIERARRSYNINFPKCPTPKELIKGEKHYLDNCPFIINEANPCLSSACSDVDWSQENYRDLNLDKNCKKMVSNYCHINSDLDERCICWNPKYKDDEKCKAFKEYFEEPSDYCSPGQFKIEEHPDFSKYIKKDKQLSATRLYLIKN
jgi:hypothetical protein